MQSKKSNRFDFYWDTVVEEVRTIFARRGNATIYIPTLAPPQPTLATAE